MRFLALLALAFLPLLATAAEPLKPFVANYDVKRGGKVIGEATMTLRDNGDRQWTLMTETRGTAGMARLLGLDVREESDFIVDQATLQSTNYRYKQDATLKSRQRRIEFDWQANEARVTDKDELFRYPLQAGSIDRQIVVVALGRSQQLDDNTLYVAAKEGIEKQRFERRETRSLNLPAGRYEATRFERTDKPNKGSSWYTPGLLAPLQIEQLQKDGNTIVMELKAIR
jgi:hypothetical protein